MKTLKPVTNVIVGPCRFSYCNVFKPRMNDTRNEEEFSVTLLFPKAPHQFLPDPKAELRAINETIKLALAEKFPQEPAVWTSPLKDGDKELNKDSGEPKHPGYWFLTTRCSTDYPPIVLGPTRAEISATDGWVSGDWGKVQVNFFAYDTKGNKGVSSSLRAVQFRHKDEPFGVARDAASVAAEFDDAAGAESDPFADD